MVSPRPYIQILFFFFSTQLITSSRKGTWSNGNCHDYHQSRTCPRKRPPLYLYEFLFLFLSLVHQHHKNEKTTKPQKKWSYLLWVCVREKHILTDWQQILQRSKPAPCASRRADTRGGKKYPDQDICMPWCLSASAHTIYCNGTWRYHCRYPEIKCYQRITLD